MPERPLDLAGAAGLARQSFGEDRGRHHAAVSSLADSTGRLVCTTRGDAQGSGDRVMAAGTGEQERGRDAEVTSEIPKAGWRDVLWRLKDAIREDRITLIAAGSPSMGCWRCSRP
jgi:hypothetical protein